MRDESGLVTICILYFHLMVAHDEVQKREVFWFRQHKPYLYDSWQWERVLYRLA